MPLSTSVVQKLQTIGKDITVHPIVRELSERRAQKITDVYRVKLALMRGGFQFSDLEMHQFFERLEKAGVGKLKVQQRPLHSVFTWNYNVHDVADALRGNLTPEGLINKPGQLKQMLHLNRSAEITPPPSPKSPPAASTTVFLPTPSGELATLTLNASLDQETALMLSQYLAKVAESLR